MNRLNTMLVFIAPFLVYLLGLWGSKQALIGIIVYLVWIFVGLDEADYNMKKRHDRLQA